MKINTWKNAAGALASILVSTSTTSAQQAFDSGSDGSLGALNVTGVVKIQLPPDGVLNYTTINISENGSVQFIKNAANTPVYMLATGDVVIAGLINVSGGDSDGTPRGGFGGIGGFDGGNGGGDPSNGYGPGGGQGGWISPASPNGEDYRGSGSFASLARSRGGTPAAEGKVYGNSFLIPMIGGSGGGGGQGAGDGDHRGGGGGGGAILLATNTKITFEGFNATTKRPSILIRGGNGSGAGFGYGSGGSLRLVSPVLAGDVFMYSGSSPSNDAFTEGGYGRIRVDSLARENLSLVFRGSGSTKNLGAAYTTYGANMIVFPPNLPEVRITQAAAQSIAADRIDPVFVLLPAGSSSTQTVRVSCKNFNSIVQLVAVVTPESGEKQQFEFSVDNSSGGTTEGNVQVQIPAGISSRVDVWTR